jgi:hypothetical protein
MLVSVQTAVCLSDGIYRSVDFDVEVSDIVNPGNVWFAAQEKVNANAAGYDVVAVGLKGYQVKDDSTV